MNLKEKLFPDSRLGLDRFWNFSRGGIDNFRTGLRPITGMGSLVPHAHWFGDGVFSINYFSGWP
jgi:hypothetical protein